MSLCIDLIDDALPQTQCRQCGYDGCRAYAQAIVEGAPINRCAPGGREGIARLAELTDRPVLELDPDYGHEAPFAVARIDATRCIGCRLCAVACPVGSITGAPKRLFAVIEETCTGCALCVAPCPMDCVELVELERSWTREDARRAREAYLTTQRLRSAMLLKKDAEKEHDDATKKAVLDDVMARVRAMMQPR